MKFFSLVELIVVIAILALIATLLQPSLKKMMLSAKQIECSQNLRTIGLKTYQYVEENNDQFPGPLYNRINSVTWFNLGKFLRPYYSPLQFEEYPNQRWRKYIPELMCPKNKEESYDDDVRLRPQYQVHNRTSDNVWTFGRPLMNLSNGVTLTLIAPAYASEITNHAVEKMMSDYDDFGRTRGTSPSVPDYPVHGLGSRNVLFLDQHVEAEFVNQ